MENLAQTLILQKIDSKNLPREQVRNRSLFCYYLTGKNLQLQKVEKWEQMEILSMDTIYGKLW